MKISLHRQNDKFRFQAKNENGKTIQLDASSGIGGENSGFRPMELLLAGIGGCSGVDVVNILKKQRQEPFSLSIEVDGEREKDKEPALYESVRLHFQVEGEVEADKLKRAVSLSVDKYCSVARILEKTAEITYEIQLNGKTL